MKTLTWNMEDALISPESFAILSGAGLIDASVTKPAYIHTTSQVEVANDGIIEILFEDVPEAKTIVWNGGRINPVAVDDEHYHREADIYCMVMTDGDIGVEPCVPAKIEVEADRVKIYCVADGHADHGVVAGDIVMVDYYIKRTSNVMQIEITPESFGGNFYLEAETLFRRENDGVDMPAEFIIPNCKVQSNFTFTMSASGDPSVFNFVLDCFPDYTKFDKTQKVLSAIQVITDKEGETEFDRPACGAPVISTVKGVKMAIAAEANSANITLSGSATAEYDEDTFPITETAVQVNIELPTDGKAGTYKVVQENPGLVYFAGDSTITGTTKTKTYNIAANEVFEYQFLVTDQGGPIDIEFSDANGVIYTYHFEVDGLNITR